MEDWIDIFQFVIICLRYCFCCSPSEFMHFLNVPRNPMCLISNFNVFFFLIKKLKSTQFLAFILFVPVLYITCYLLLFTLWVWWIWWHIGFWISCREIGFFGFTINEGASSCWRVRDAIAAIDPQCSKATGGFCQQTHDLASGFTFKCYA